jgi:hypothetical protein
MIFRWLWCGFAAPQPPERIGRGSQTALPDFATALWLTFLPRKLAAAQSLRIICTGLIDHSPEWRRDRACQPTTLPPVCRRRSAGGSLDPRMVAISQLISRFHHLSCVVLHHMFSPTADQWAGSRSINGGRSERFYVQKWLDIWNSDRVHRVNNTPSRLYAFALRTLISLR